MDRAAGHTVSTQSVGSSGSHGRTRFPERFCFCFFFSGKSAGGGNGAPVHNLVAFRLTIFLSTVSLRSSPLLILSVRLKKKKPFPADARAEARPAFSSSATPTRLPRARGRRAGPEAQCGRAAAPLPRPPTALAFSPVRPAGEHLGSNRSIELKVFLLVS